MNRQFIISGVVLFILVTLFGFFVHAILLQADYAQLPNLMRPEDEAMGLMHFQLLAHLLIAIGLTWIYRMGHDPAKGWAGQGARFGIAVALVSSIPFFLIYYVVVPFPESLVVKQILFETPSLVIVGMATAFLNK
jgi:hypothetical protein